MMGNTILAGLSDRFEDPEIQLNEDIGQHLLINPLAVKTFVAQIEIGNYVLEIGPGPGNLTVEMANRASKVVAIEIDKRWEPRLRDVQDRCDNIEVIYKDVLSLDLRKIMGKDSSGIQWQVAANLPFHISEPFLHQLITVPIDSAVLILGDQLVRRMRISDPNDIEFTSLSMLVQTFFEVTVLAKLDKEAFYPVPRTEAAIVLLNSRERSDFDRNVGLSVLKRLFLSEKTNSSVEKIIKGSLYQISSGQVLSKPDSHRYERRRNRSELRFLVNSLNDGQVSNLDSKFSRYSISELGLPQELLSKPFRRLNNQEIRVLANALNKRFSVFTS